MNDTTQPGPDNHDDSATADTAPTHLTVVPWFDPFLAEHGYDPRSAYVERFWLGVLGPSATWLIRRLARGFDGHPDGFRVNLADTARALGLGEGTGRNSMISRTVDRACQFGAAQRHGRDRLALRTHLAPLNARQLQRLPAAVQRSHEIWMAQPIHPEQRQLALTTALALTQEGLDPSLIEQHLVGTGMTERLAHEATRDAHLIVRGAPVAPNQAG